MSGIVMLILVGLLGGVAVGVQSPIAGAMSQRVGGTASSLIVHVSGAVISLALLLLRRGEQVQRWHTLPPYMLGAGAFGVVLYLTLSRTLPHLGATAALSLIIVGQLLTGMVIDQFGGFGVATRPVDGTRLLATGLLLAGAFLMIRK